MQTMPFRANGEAIVQADRERAMEGQTALHLSKRQERLKSKLKMKEDYVDRLRRKSTAYPDGIEEEKRKLTMR